MRQKTTMAALALALAAPAVLAAQIPEADSAQIQELHAEVKGDKKELAAGGQARKARLKELREQEAAELAALKGFKGSRKERAAAREAIRAKYAEARQDLIAHRRFAKRSLRDDMQSKRGRIRRLRQGS